ncbi:elongation factor G (EF-G) [Plasmodium ovale wallikeri]|uniref:Elongation factor G (EF-G) n=1 Tax=Plasmodium ovale wallikeri TaxID=864142 RepID=A0A1A8Z7S7_PLAOA|nr:elongation factor G (EF-G) [Plasmodium ovale wallikeri]
MKARRKKNGVRLFILSDSFGKKEVMKIKRRRNKVSTFQLKLTFSPKKNVELENYRNIGIIAHIDAGKTTTTERILFYTNVIKRIGEVHEGLSTMDYLDIEKEKGITINAAVTTCYWNGSEKNLQDCRINIIDTPGHVDFTAEVEKSLRVLDGGVVVFDSSEGVESQSETVWKQANRYNISRIIFLNKMDKIGSNFELCIEEIKKKLNKKILILYIPIFEMNKFICTIDILKEKIIVYNNSHNFIFNNIPTSYYNIFLKYKNLLYEQIAENFNCFLDNYLNDKIMNIKEIELYIRKLVVQKKYNVVICGSALKNKNIHMLLDLIVKYLPSPIDSIDNYKKQIIYKHDVNKKGEKIPCPHFTSYNIDVNRKIPSKENINSKIYKSVNTKQEQEGDNNTSVDHTNCDNRRPSSYSKNNILKTTPYVINNVNSCKGKEEGKFNELFSEELNEQNIKNYNRKMVGLIYKIMNDQHLGNINYVRIYEGQINRGDYIYNNRTKKSEKISKIFFIHSSEKYELDNARAGDIVGLVGLKDTQIGDTLSNIFLRAELKKIKDIPPIISFYIYNKNKNEYEKLINALAKIKKEDHSFFYHINQDTKDLLISGVGELHLQIIINKIQKDFNIPIMYGQPQISYKETFVQNVEARGKYIKQSGGRGQYGDVHLKIEPMYTYSEDEEEEEGEEAGAGEEANEENRNNDKHIDKNSMNIDTSEVNNNIIIKNEITCGAIPSMYFDAIYTGIREQCNLGVLSSSPLINIIVRIVDGSFHAVDSNEHAFKLAAGMAIREAARKTALNVSVPTEYLGDVISDLVKKRGKIQHIDESKARLAKRSFICLSRRALKCLHVPSHICYFAHPLLRTRTPPHMCVYTFFRTRRRVYQRNNRPSTYGLHFILCQRSAENNEGERLERLHLKYCSYFFFFKMEKRRNYTMSLHKYSLVPQYIQEQILEKKD